jgi:hypothetical protein
MRPLIDIAYQVAAAAIIVSFRIWSRSSPMGQSFSQQTL